ncbi:MAG: ACT domain-containing protein [Candidatus Omnitrophica bacterium]|nr:ACT domain-containing protein [Candidatus Omnitrophota bacterium]
MIKSMSIGHEVSVVVINEVGALAKVTSFLVNHGINVDAVAGYSNHIGDQAGLMFITDDNVSAINELTRNGYEDVRENEVIIVELENTPGALKNISERLTQKDINIAYIYCTTCMQGCPAKIILSTSDNERAFELLKS